MNGHANNERGKDPKSEPMDHDGCQDDDSDPVVHEIPVFIAKSLQNNLYLFQVQYSIIIIIDLES